MKLFQYLYIFIFSISLSGCVIYSFSGISTNAESFQVNYFQNNSQLVEPGLEILFRNTLQDLIVNQTSLNLVTTGGEVIYEGEITEYRIAPMTATAQNTAAQNRLTIGVNVRYFNTLDEEESFERNFSFFYDYPANAQLVGGVKDEAFEVIFERITQDILNASLADW